MPHGMRRTHADWKTVLGSLNYVPVHFLYKSLPSDELTALYASADICFVCSTRDGLNLVCYEYVACRDNDLLDLPPGVLVLSQFTGASSTLKGALLVNPWDKAQCAEVVAQAVTMDSGEAKERMQQLKSTVLNKTRYAEPLLHFLATHFTITDYQQLPMGTDVPPCSRWTRIEVCRSKSAAELTASGKSDVEFCNLGTRLENMP